MLTSPLRFLLALHRWLGVGIGLLMTVWCLSGFVMMYSGYPRLLPVEQVRGLSPLRLPAAAGLDGVPLAAKQRIASARIEMLAGRAVLRIAPVAEIGAAYDVATGAAVGAVAAAEAEAVARDFGDRSSIDGALRSLAESPVDQWTVQVYGRHAPLYRAEFADPAGTRIYLSGRSGEAVQQATRAERFWGWLGAVPHWLYPTMLRQDGALWSRVVVWSSLLGCFLTATGMIVGVARLRFGGSGIGSPFRGLWWWHHTMGFVFGVLTLTWVASGLVSMNPWGFLDSAAGPGERERLAGPLPWRDVRAALAGVGALPVGTVRLEVAPLGGRAYLLATRGDGTAQRLAGGDPARLERHELAAAIAAAFPLRALVLLREEDAYYYGERSAAPLPVWRATLADRDATRLY
ncbi:MAG: PepSY domain-containing protein, partial [Novosphingobium sp.]